MDDQHLLDTHKSLVVFAEGMSDTGLARAKNEDRFWLDPGKRLFLVADGLGGQPAGDAAAEAVVSLLPDMIARQFPAGTLLFREEEIRDKLVTVLLELSVSLWQGSKGKLGLEGMGATLAMVWIQRGTAYLANMGDSRVYRYRDGGLGQLTEDHTITAMLVKSGDISPDEAKTHPARGRLSRYMGMEREVFADVKSMQIQRNDLFLICSDGLTSLVEDDQIAGILASKNTLEEKCRALIGAGNQAGGKDNITCVLVDCQ